jgi:hypothetical protein
MPRTLRDAVIALAGAAATAAAFYAATPAAGQAPASRIPRTADGKPNLNGIWQTLNTANYDLEAHEARMAMAMRPGPVNPVPAKEVVALGAVGSVPGGMGVVVGGPIPTSPQPCEEGESRTLAQRATGNPGATARSLARPTCRSVQIFQATRPSSSRTCTGAVRNVYLKIQGLPGGLVDGPIGQPMGGGTFVIETMDSTIRAGSIALAIITVKR